MDKGFWLRVIGAALFAISGMIFVINYLSIKQLQGSNPNNITFLFNILFLATPIALIGLFIIIAGRNAGSKDSESEYARKRAKNRPLT